MLYLKSLTVDRFKSFSHADLLFSKGFTCVVGPNGSGKSNICDALLFGLGESSLRRLRANKLESLISMDGKRRRTGLRKAYVRMELGGDGNISVVRAVRSDGKSLYKVNGRHYTRQEALELLQKHGMHADETNTITQGEVNRFVELTPKERRELIDIMSGIQEFEYKKAESLGELEKVSQRIGECQIVLNERTGFLKELSAEKEAAEKYASMSARLKALNYSIIVAKKGEIEKAYADYTSRMAILDSKKNELGYKLEELTKKLEESGSERQRLTKELGESAQAIGEINAKLEAINIEFARIGAELNNNTALLSEGEKMLKELMEEEERLNKSVRQNAVEIAQLNKGIGDAEKEFERYGAKKRKMESEVADIKALEESVKKIEEKLLSLQDGVSEAHASLSILEASIQRKALELENQRNVMEEKARQQARLAAELKASTERLGSLTAKIKGNEADIDRINREMGVIDENTIELREQKAMHQPRGNATYDKIKERFGGRNGFYGRTSELCTYKPEHAYAVEVSAGARFEYIVVDSMKTADDIIEYLKKGNLGRATFIPVRELNIQQGREGETDLTSVIDVIKFNPELRKVFLYIFGNTYIISDSEDAEKHGVGKHRYVTLSGELIEQSGIISGGSASRRLLSANIDSQLGELLKRKSALKKELEGGSAVLFNIRKEEAYVEMERKGVEEKIRQLADDLEDYKESLEKSLAEMHGLEAKYEKMKGESEAKEYEKADTVKRLEESKERVAAAYNKTIEMSENISENGAGEGKPDLDTLRREAENLRIRKAEVQKENQIYEQRLRELTVRISEKTHSVNETKGALEEYGIRRAVLEKSKAAVGKEMAGSGDFGRKITDRLNSIDSEIAKVSGEHGRTSAEYSNAERELSEIVMKRGQLETRLNDLTAELGAYKEEAKVLNGDTAEMEREAGVLGVRINELGNVNLKAPEVYDEKKKDVDDAALRVETLNTERQAILRMIEEVDSKKLQVFMSALNDVAKNFSKLYNYIFPGSAAIRLEDPKDPFNSGLEIGVSNGKVTRLLSGMSGGEKSLISLILIFSIHMCKPSSLYIFDEVDAALDKENSKKLSQLIKQMSRNAQFIVVSHNDSLIIDADTAIGVVKVNDESKAIGIAVSSITNRN